MTFLNIENVEKLFGAFDRCSGSVELIAPDGKAYDWKTHAGALRVLLAQVDHIDRLEVRARESRDRESMLRLMMQDTVREKAV